MTIDQRQRVKFGAIGIVLMFVALVIWIIILYIQNLGRSATLDLLVAPSFAQVKINDQTYANKVSSSFEPGDYTVEISAEGFQTKQETISLRQGETTQLYTYLIPEDGDMSWYANHSSEDMLLTSIGSRNATIKSTTYLADFPISAILPIEVVEVDPNTYDWVEYRIDGGKFDQCHREFCIKITDTTGGNHDAALEQIRAKGYNPDDYEIIYNYAPVQPLN